MNIKGFILYYFFEWSRKPPSKGKRHEQAHNAQSKARSKPGDLASTNDLHQSLSSSYTLLVLSSPSLELPLKPQPCARHRIQSWWEASPPFSLTDIQKLIRDDGLPHAAQLSMTVLASPKCLTDARLLACHGLGAHAFSQKVWEESCWHIHSIRISVPCEKHPTNCCSSSFMTKGTITGCHAHGLFYGRGGVLSAGLVTAELTWFSS